MEASEVLDIIAGGETSKAQFKLNVTNATSIAQEIVAFANTKGGFIIIGVNDKTGAVEGLSFKDIQRINNLLTTAANEHVKSPISIETETVAVEPEKRIILVRVPEGFRKPYKDKDGLVFVKNGSDKRVFSAAGPFSLHLPLPHSLEYSMFSLLINRTHQYRQHPIRREIGHLG